MIVSERVSGKVRESDPNRCSVPRDDTEILARTMRVITGKTVQFVGDED